MNVELPDSLPWELIERVWSKVPGGITCFLCGHQPTNPHGCSQSDLIIRRYLVEHPEELRT